MVFLLALFLSATAWCKGLPTTVSASGGWDSSGSRIGSVDASIGVYKWGLVDIGSSTTRTEYDETETLTRNLRFGLGSNPLMDLSFGINYEYEQFSDQFEAHSLRVPMNYYLGNWAFRIVPGWRTLRLKLTQALQQSQAEQFDRSFFGTAEITYFINSQWAVNAYYTHYNYERNFSGLTGIGALLLGYLPATTESAAGLLRFSVGGGGSYFYKKLAIAADISRSETEFVTSALNIFSATFGYEINSWLYVNVSRGWSSVVTDTERLRGSFTNIGFSATIP